MMLARRLQGLDVLPEWKFRAIRLAPEQRAGPNHAPNSEDDKKSTLLPRIFLPLYARDVTKHNFAHVLRIYPTISMFSAMQ